MKFTVVFLVYVVGYQIGIRKGIRNIVKVYLKFIDKVYYPASGFLNRIDKHL